MICGIESHKQLPLTKLCTFEECENPRLGCEICLVRSHLEHHAHIKDLQAVATGLISFHNQYIEAKREFTTQVSQYFGMVEERLIKQFHQTRDTIIRQFEEAHQPFEHLDITHLKEHDYMWFSRQQINDYQFNETKAHQSFSLATAIYSETIERGNQIFTELEDHLTQENVTIRTEDPQNGAENLQLMYIDALPSYQSEQKRPQRIAKRINKHSPVQGIVVRLKRDQSKN